MATNERRLSQVGREIQRVGESLYSTIQQVLQKTTHDENSPIKNINY